MHPMQKTHLKEKLEMEYISVLPYIFFILDYEPFNLHILRILDFNLRLSK